MGLFAKLYKSERTDVPKFDNYESENYQFQYWLECDQLESAHAEHVSELIISCEIIGQL